jgi:hypothetical protein
MPALLCVEHARKGSIVKAVGHTRDAGSSVRRALSAVREPSLRPHTDHPNRQIPSSVPPRSARCSASSCSRHPVARKCWSTVAVASAPGRSCIAPFCPVRGLIKSVGHHTLKSGGLQRLVVIQTHKSWREPSMDASSNSSARRRCRLGLGIGALACSSLGSLSTQTVTAPRPAAKQNDRPGLATTRCSGRVMTVCREAPLPYRPTAKLRPGWRRLPKGTSLPLRSAPPAGNPLANTVSESEPNDQKDCDLQHCGSRQLRRLQLFTPAS